MSDQQEVDSSVTPLSWDAESNEDFEQTTDTGEKVNDIIDLTERDEGLTQ
jgi:hypothetical protein